MKIVYFYSNRDSDLWIIDAVETEAFCEFITSGSNFLCPSFCFIQNLPLFIEIVVS